MAQERVMVEGEKLDTAVDCTKTCQRSWTAYYVTPERTRGLPILDKIHSGVRGSGEMEERYGTYETLKPARRP